MTPKAIKTEIFELGGEVIELHLLDNGQTVIPEESIEKFKQLIMNKKITDKQAREFSSYIANYKFS